MCIARLGSWLGMEAGHRALFERLIVGMKWTAHRKVAGFVHVPFRLGRHTHPIFVTQNQQMIVLWGISPLAFETEFPCEHICAAMKRRNETLKRFRWAHWKFEGVQVFGVNARAQLRLVTPQNLGPLVVEIAQELDYCQQCLDSAKGMYFAGQKRRRPGEHDHET